MRVVHDTHMLKPIEVVSCDDCVCKIEGDPDGTGAEYYCDYGTFDALARAAPADCELRNGNVIVTLAVRR